MGINIAYCRNELGVMPTGCGNAGDLGDVVRREMTVSMSYSSCVHPLDIERKRYVVAD